MARSLRVEIVGDTRGLSRAFRSATGQSGRFASGMTRAMGPAGGLFARATRGVADFGRKTLGALNPLRGMGRAVASAAAAFVGFEAIKSVVSTTDDLAKAAIGLHKALGLSIQTASAWGSLAMARNIDTKQLAQGFGLLSKQVYAAVHGSKASAVAFKELGIPVKALAHMGAEKIIERVSDGLHNMKGGVEKTALMMKLFGRGWQTVIPLLRDGSKKVREQIGLAREYGATLDGHAIKSTKDWLKAQRESKLSMIGLKITLADVLVPALAKGARGFAHMVNWMRTNKTFGAVVHGVYTGIAWAASHVLYPALKGIIGAGIAVVSWFKSNWPQIQRVARDVFSKIENGVTAVVAVFRRHWPEIKTIAVAVFSVVRAVVERFVSAVVSTWNTFGSNIKAAARDTWNFIRDYVRGALKTIQGIIDLVTGLIKGDWGKVWKGIKEIFSGVWTAIVAEFRIIKNGLVNIADALGKAMLQTLKAQWSLLKGAARAAFGLVVSAVRGLAGAARSAAHWVGARILGGLKAGWSGIVSAVHAIFTAIRNAVFSAGAKVFSAASHVGQRILAGIRAGWSGIVGAVTNIFSSVRSAVFNAGARAFSAAAHVGQRIFAGIRNGASGITSWIGGIIGRAGHAFAGAAGAAVHAALAIGKAIVHGIKQGFVDGFVGMASWIGSQITGAVSSAVGGIKGAHFGKVPFSGTIDMTKFHHAAGTMNFPGGLGMVGERGPELVNMAKGSRIFSATQTSKMLRFAAAAPILAAAPLPTLSTVAPATAAGGLTVTVNLNVDKVIGASPDEFAREISPAIVREIRKHARRNGSAGLA